MMESFDPNGVMVNIGCEDNHWKKGYIDELTIGDKTLNSENIGKTIKLAPVYDTGWVNMTAGDMLTYTPSESGTYYVIALLFKDVDNTYIVDLQTSQYGDANQHNGVHVCFTDTTFSVVTDVNLVHGIYVNKSGVRTLTSNVKTGYIRAVIGIL